MKATTIVLVFLSLSVLIFGVIYKEEKFHQTYEMTAGNKITLININGSIKIEGWDKNYVDFLAIKKTKLSEKEFKKVEITIKEENGLDIETIHLKKNPKVSVSYELKVPKKITLDLIESSNGSITIEKVGEISNLITSNGSIKVFDSNGNITAETSNGSIIINDFNGSVSARTSNSKIEMKNINGFVDAVTSNGSIKLINTKGILGAKTSNSSIKAQVSSVPDNVELHTSNGSVTLYFDKNLNANIDASTSNGKINLHDIKINAHDISRSYVSGYIGKGGHQINIKTSNGSINLYNSDEIVY